MGMMTVQEQSSSSHTALQVVADILSNAPSIEVCHLRPHPNCSLFISWHGCIVLVYEGFPPPLIQAKMRITHNNNSSLNLREEKFGSKWPKTTLGAVNDGVDDLSPEQFKRLRDICNQYSKKIINTQNSIDNNITRNEIKVSTLSVVEYKQRGLEMLSERINVPLDMSSINESYNSVEQDSSNSTPSEDERSRVNNVISEWNDVQTYLPKVNAHGSHIGSYRQNLVGRTCVAFIDSNVPQHLRDCLSEFRAAVDEEFPGRYAWLDQASLHCTLRSLDEY